MKIFKDFFDCKIVLAANHHYPENIQRLFCLQKCLRRKSSLSWKYSKTFSPAKLSSTQITIILKIFKDFFACNIVLDANHHYPGNIQIFFRWQLCLRRKSSLSIILKKSKDFFACNIVFDANHRYPENIQRLFRLQYCLRCKSSLSWKHSKTFSLANCLGRKSSLSWNYSKTFLTAKCLSRKSSLSWKHSKTFLPAKMSSTQIIIKLKVFKDFFACKIVFDANHHYPENIQRLFRLQYCLRCKSSLSWKHSKIFSLATLS